jgi:antitoxin CcdA
LFAWTLTQKRVAHYAHIRGHDMKSGYDLEARKRPVTLTLNVDLVQNAEDKTDNLSGVVESLLSDFVVHEQKQRLTKAKSLEATMATWNEFNAKSGSFADEYSSL